MFGKILLVAFVAASALAQEQPSIRTSTDESAPEDAERLLRKTPFDAPAVVVVGPPTRTSGSCSIPLLEATPKAEGTIRRMQPREDAGTMRFVAPPAPACEGWNRKPNQSPVLRFWNRRDEDKSPPRPRP